MGTSTHTDIWQEAHKDPRSDLHMASAQISGALQERERKEQMARAKIAIGCLATFVRRAEAELEILRLREEAKATLDLLTEEADKCCQRAFAKLAAHNPAEWICPTCEQAYKPRVEGTVRHWEADSWAARL
jgi:CO/xanthine dehydrogenase FAD-binding subunit